MGMMSLRRRVLEKNGGGLPYDAELEWLETSRTQWIDTGITFNGVENFEFLLTFAPTRFYNYNAISCIGTGTTNESWIDRGGKFSWRYQDLKSSAVQLTLNQKTTLKVIYNYPTTTVYFDDELKYTGGYTVYMTSTDSLWLFHRSDYAELVFYSCEIYQNGEKIADYIPVRIGTTGYIYNKVSGKMFGNQGTDDFILGPDKN